MTTLTSLVPDRDTCEKFKAAGMPQGKSALAWVRTRDFGDNEGWAVMEEEEVKKYDRCAAPSRLARLRIAREIIKETSPIGRGDAAELLDRVECEIKGEEEEGA